MDEFYQLFGISAEEFLDIPMEDIDSSDDSSLESDEEDDVEIDANGNVIWSETTSHVETPAFLKDEYGGLITPEDRSFLGYFSLMITEEIFQLIADQTNSVGETC